MRAKKQSIVYYIYFDKTITFKSCPEGVYSGYRIHRTVVSDPNYVRNSYNTVCSHRSLFNDIPPSKTAIGYTPYLNLYYVLDASS
jgi:hypothetical protein